MNETVVAILFAASAGGEAGLRHIRARHEGAKLIVLTVPGLPEALQRLADEVWTDGRARGPGRFLALMRRLAWARASHIYDLEASGLTRFMRFCVWPRPKWHGCAHPGGLS